MATATHLAADDGAEWRDSRRDSRRQACEAARLRPDASERYPIPWLGLDFLVGLMSDGPKKLKNCSLVTWAMTRATTLVALVLGPPMLLYYLCNL